MTETEKSSAMGVSERILRSRIMRGIFRIHIGGSLVRSWSLDIQEPTGSSIHLFDYLLYLKTNQGETFEEWVKQRQLY